MDGPPFLPLPEHSAGPQASLVRLSTHLSRSPARLTPGALGPAVQVWLAVFLCPLDLFWRPSRVFLMRILRHLALAPLYRVMLADFFVGDQLTSQVAHPLLDPPAGMHFDPHGRLQGSKQRCSAGLRWLKISGARSIFEALKLCQRTSRDSTFMLVLHPCCTGSCFRRLCGPSLPLTWCGLACGADPVPAAAAVLLLLLLRRPLQKPRRRRLHRQRHVPQHALRGRHPALLVPLCAGRPRLARCTASRRLAASSRSEYQRSASVHVLGPRSRSNSFYQFSYSSLSGFSSLLSVFPFQKRPAAMTIRSMSRPVFSRASRPP